MSCKKSDFGLIAAVLKCAATVFRNSTFFSKGHNTKVSKIPFISNLKKTACASKQDALELATLRYSYSKFLFTGLNYVIYPRHDIHMNVKSDASVFV